MVPTATATTRRAPRRWAVPCLALLAAALSAGCASVAQDGASPSAPAVAAAARAPHDPAAIPLHEALQGLATKYGVCSVAVAVIKDRQVHAVDAARGCEPGPALAPDSVFEAASLSKPVFAYAVLKLVQEGKLDLDAPVMKYLPAGYEHRFHPHLANSATDNVADPRLQAVTVRMALNHTSGLPNWAGGPLAFDLPPGQKWHYSGEGYALLQRAVESVTGERLDAFMARRVFEPLGMAHSGYTRQARFEKQIVRGTTKDGNPRTSWPFTVPVSAFTLYTSAQDYGRFLAALLRDEQVLAQVTGSPVPVNPKLGRAWGLGWGMERRQDGLFLWHWGNNPGYRAFVMASPTSGDGFVMFTGSDAGLALAEPLGNRILGGPHPAFRFHLLRDGLASLLCESIDVCP